MFRSTTYRVLAVVSGCALLAIPVLIPGRLDIPRPSGETTISHNTTPYGSSARENFKETVSLLFYGLRAY